MNDERLQTLRQWFSISFSSISDFILETFPAARHDAIQHRLLTDLHRCSAETPKQLREFCRNRVLEYATETRLIERIENPSLSDVLAVAGLRSTEGVKEFKYEQHGDTVFIKLEDSKGNVLPWRVPVSWLPVARALWPVHIRRMSQSRPYVSKKVKKQRLNGEWFQVDMPVHQLFLNAPVGARVDAADGSYLNYCDGNLSEHNALPATAEAREISLDVLSERLTADWIPAKTKRLPKHRDGKPLNAHERQVQRWLYGELD
jgi:hypothetical protein